MLYPLSYGVWWAREDSNLRVGCLVYSQVQSPLVPHALGWVTGLAPAFSGFTGRRSALSYTYRGRRRDRTFSLRGVNALLSH